MQVLSFVGTFTPSKHKKLYDIYTMLDQRQRRSAAVV